MQRYIWMRWVRANSLACVARAELKSTRAQLGSARASSLARTTRAGSWLVGSSQLEPWLGSTRARKFVETWLEPEAYLKQCCGTNYKAKTNIMCLVSDHDTDRCAIATARGTDLCFAREMKPRRSSLRYESR